MLSVLGNAPLEQRPGYYSGPVDLACRIGRTRQRVEPPSLVALQQSQTHAADSFRSGYFFIRFFFEISYRKSVLKIFEV